MNSRELMVSLVALYLLIVFMMSVLAARRVKKSEDFIVSGYGMGMFYVALAMAAEYMGGLGTIGCAERAFKNGMGVIWYHISAAIGIAVFAIFFAHYYRKYRVQTVPEYTYYLYDVKTWKAQTVLNVIAYTTFLIIEITALGSILAGITGMDLSLAVIIGGLFITAYVALGGMWGVAYTSLLYMATMYIGLPLAFFWILYFKVPELPGSGGLAGFTGLANAMTAKGMDPGYYFSPFSLGPAATLGFLIGGILAVPAAQATINYAFGARNWKVSRLAPLFAAALVVPLSIWTGTAGIYAKVAGLTTNPKLALGQAFTTLPPVIGALGSAGVFAAIISTAAAILFADATVFARDILHRWLKPEVSDEQVLKWTRISVVCIGILCTIGASVSLPEILRSAYFVYSLRSVTLVLVAFGIYWSRSHPDAAFWTTLLGFAAAFVYMFTPLGKILHLHVAIFTVIIAIPVFVIISLLRKWTPTTAADVPPGCKNVVGGE